MEAQCHYEVGQAHIFLLVKKSALSDQSMRAPARTAALPPPIASKVGATSTKLAISLEFVAGTDSGNRIKKGCVRSRYRDFWRGRVYRVP